MRLSELLGKEVVDRAGARVGHVHDVRLSQDGPMGAGFDAGLRVLGLVVGRGGTANRLGYGRTGSRGPWLIRVVLQGRHQARFVPWSEVVTVDDDRIVVTGESSELSTVRPAASGGSR
jgi:sporulation protein YlmC with PRC-barrel domain